MSQPMNFKIKDLSDQISELLKKNHEKDLVIKELTEEKRVLLYKYDTSKQLNFDLYTQLHTYSDSLKKVQDDLDRKAKAIAVYIKNMNENKKTMTKERSNLICENQALKDKLKANDAIIDRLKGDLCTEQQQYQDMRNKLTEIKDKTTVESKRLITSLEEQNQKLRANNKELKQSIENIKQSQNKSQQQLKNDLVTIHDSKEQQLKRTIGSLRNRCVDLKRQIDCNEREAIAYQYKSKALKTVYTNGIKKLMKFGVDNNEEVLTAIIQVMEKMRSNSQRRIMDKSAKTMIDIRNHNNSIENEVLNIIEQKDEQTILKLKEEFDKNDPQKLPTFERA